MNAVFENLLPDNADLRRRIAERTEVLCDRPNDLLAAIGPPAIEAVANALPAGFPDRVAGPVFEHARNRMTLLTGQFDAGQIGRA
ncbi:MAG: hypothetical protein C0524_01555 [Rhodobacter sp.]|nr:hypothetical protein [Rhodobacter sp.]